MMGKVNVQLRGSSSDMDRIYEFMKLHTKKATRILKAFDDAIEFEVTVA